MWLVWCRVLFNLQSWSFSCISLERSTGVSGIVYRPACWRPYLPPLKPLTGESLNLCFVTVCSVCGTVWTRGCATLGRGDGSHFCLHCEYSVLLSTGSDTVLPTPLYAFQCLACRNSAGMKISTLNAWSKCGCARPGAYWMDSCLTASLEWGRTEEKEVPVVIHCWGSVTRCSVPWMRWEEVKWPFLRKVPFSKLCFSKLNMKKQLR